MRPFAFLVAALTVVPGVLAVDQMKSVIIWADEGSSITKDMMDKAKQSIKDAGGQITHEYNFIFGFAAVTPVKVLESVQAFGADLKIEDDHKVTG